ncbi:Mariner Mos1 transposase [Eumeta japonica]|uniref:Mariner Mos1 transposase n=1 Tax=Eumeta variegata TaxID=151549 RepID=A0A4C2A1E5_EUMVA|nr:Mariner Mos1 transposase [Eumeta japonica]
MGDPYSSSNYGSTGYESQYSVPPPPINPGNYGGTQQQPGFNQNSYSNSGSTPNWNQSSAEAHQLLGEAYNEAALSERACCKWVQKFEDGDFDLEDKDHSRRPKIYEDGELEEDFSQTQKELALTLEVTQPAISHHLKSIGMIHKQAVLVKNYLKTFDWKVLPHPYSPDIAPSDDHLFRSVAHALSEQRFTSYEGTKNYTWIASKDKEFFRLGI